MSDDHFTGLLRAYETSEPSFELRSRIIAAAPRQRAIGRAWRWAAGAGLGFGLAASCAAGVAAGFTLAPSGLTRLIGEPPASASDLSSLADPGGSPGDDAADG